MTGAPKGYVVRGKGRSSARTLWMAKPDWTPTHHVVDAREEATEFTSLALAVEAAMQMGGCRDVTLLEVAEDGTERELPGYEQALAIADLARRLIRSSVLHATAGGLAKLTCNDEPYAALVDLFAAEEEAARTIPGLVCTECDRPIYRGSEHAGRTGDAAHKACRNWPAGTTFRKAGDGSRAA